jgi:sulfur-carrier protein
MMTIHVRLFAAIRETLRRENVALTLPEGATPEDVWQSLLALEGGAGLAARRNNLAAAVNRKYAKFDALLADGDEVVFIPPVSGG